MVLEAQGKYIQKHSMPLQTIQKQVLMQQFSSRTHPRILHFHSTWSYGFILLLHSSLVGELANIYEYEYESNEQNGSYPTETRVNKKTQSWKPPLRKGFSWMFFGYERTWYKQKAISTYHYLLLKVYNPYKAVGLQVENKNHFQRMSIPIGSTYAIFAYLYHEPPKPWKIKVLAT